MIWLCNPYRESADVSPIHQVSPLTASSVNLILQTVYQQRVVVHKLLVDTSAVRFESGSLKPQDVRRSNASVYVAGREFLRYPATIRGLSLVTKVGGIEILRRP